MTMVVPLLPGQSRDRVRMGDDCTEYVSLGPVVMVGEPSSEEGEVEEAGEEEEEEQEEEEEEEQEEEEIDNDDDDVVFLEADG